jgi:hypothetical protein
MFVEPWQVQNWRYTNIPTVQGYATRPVIYIAVLLPAGNSYGDFGDGLSLFS